jgi:pyruvate formate lyase activating enzyme
VKIGGLQKLTLIDYPQKVACTVFLSGCNFRCPWCYSGELVLPEKIKNHPEILEEDFFTFLEKRKGKLDGVVICGGEPTINPDIDTFLEKIKGKGFLIKLDTNGSFPEIIEKLLQKNLLDYIAMDIKAPLEKYKEVVGAEIDTEKIKKSVEIIKKSGINYEFRSTLISDFHTPEDIIKMGEIIQSAEKYFLQSFRPEKTIEDSFLLKSSFSKEEMEQFKEKLSSFVGKCEIR